MQILINNKSINTTDGIYVSPVYFDDSHRWLGKFYFNTGKPTYYYFVVISKNNTIKSKKYKTKKEAITVRNRLLSYINEKLKIS